METVQLLVHERWFHSQDWENFHEGLVPLYLLDFFLLPFRDSNTSDVGTFHGIIYFPDSVFVVSMLFVPPDPFFLSVCPPDP